MAFTLLNPVKLHSKFLWKYIYIYIFYSVPYWTNFRDASKACTILLHCGCKKACRGHCKCCKAGVHCMCMRGCLYKQWWWRWWVICWVWVIMIIHVRETMRMRIHERPWEFSCCFVMLLLHFCYVKQTSKSFGQIDYIILLTIWHKYCLAIIIVSLKCIYLWYTESISIL